MWIEAEGRIGLQVDSLLRPWASTLIITPSSYSLGVPCVCVHTRVKDGTHDLGQWKSLNKMIFISLIHSRQISETLRKSVLWPGVSNNPAVASYQLPGCLLSRVHRQLVASPPCHHLETPMFHPLFSHRWTSLGQTITLTGRSSSSS